MNKEQDLLERATNEKDLIRSVLFEDYAPDWIFVRELSEYLVGIDPSLTGHLLLARALRHLGDRENAVRQLELCRVLIANQPTLGAEVVLLPVVETETLLLRES
jgi:hypothetical protein